MSDIASNDPPPQIVQLWIERYRDAADKACAPEVTPVPQGPYYVLLADLVAKAEQIRTVTEKWGWPHYYLDRMLANFDFRRRLPPKPDPKVVWRKTELGDTYPSLVRQRVAEAKAEVDDLEAEARRRADDETDKLSANARGGIRPADPKNTVDDDSILSPRELAEKWDILSKILAVQSALKRWREQNPNGSGTIWVEAADRKPREPKYFFRVGPARPVMDRIKNGQPTTSEKNIIQ